VGTSLTASADMYALLFLAPTCTSEDCPPGLLSFKYTAVDQSIGLSAWGSRDDKYMSAYTIRIVGRNYPELLAGERGGVPTELVEEVDVSRACLGSCRAEEGTW
jgi:hypothetical protein